MSDQRKPEDQPIAEEDRRRFLELATKLGMLSPVITLALARPSYAAGSGGYSGNEDDQGEDEQ